MIRYVFRMILFWIASVASAFSFFVAYQRGDPFGMIFGGFMFTVLALGAGFSIQVVDDLNNHRI